MNTVSVATSTRTHPVFAAHAHRVFFATPAGLVKDTDNLGDGVGLIEVHPSGATREVRKPVRRADPEPLPEHLVVEVFRRAARAEARVRTASDSDDSAAQVVALRASLATAERAAQTAREASRRDTGRGDLIRPLFGTWHATAWTRHQWAGCLHWLALTRLDPRLWSPHIASALDQDASTDGWRGRTLLRRTGSAVTDVS